VPSTPRPITVALVDDYDVVLLGIARMLDRYRATQPARPPRADGPRPDRRRPQQRRGRSR